MAAYNARMNRWALIVACLASLLSSTTIAEPLTVQEWPLWGDQPPPHSRSGPLVERIDECWGARCAYDVVEPTLTVFTPPGGGDGQAVLIAPGGNYDVVAIFHEGRDVARRLASAGITAAVLKYRIPRPQSSDAPHLVPLADFHQGMRVLRDLHDAGRIHAPVIGAMGFSAGSHLVNYASVHPHDDTRLNPDFTLSIYGVSRLTEVNHDWLENHLYHRPLTADEIARETLLAHVDAAGIGPRLAHAKSRAVSPQWYAPLAKNASPHPCGRPNGSWRGNGHCYGPCQNIVPAPAWCISRSMAHN